MKLSKNEMSSDEMGAGGEGSGLPVNNWSCD